MSARDMQKQNRLIAVLQQSQQQHQHQHQQQSHQQLINDQRNMSIVENNALLTSSTPTNSLNYLQQQQLLCPTLSPPSQQIHQQQTPLHSHSLVTTISNTHMPTLATTSNTIFDPRLGRLYSTGSNAVTQLTSASDFIDNGLSSIPNLPNTILINNFTQQLQPEPTQQLYQQHSIHTTQPSFQHHMPTNLQLHQSSTATHHAHAQQQNSAHSLQQQQQQQQFFSQPHIAAAASTTSQTMQLHLPTTQPFYVSADTFAAGSNAKMSAYLPPIVNNPLATSLGEVHGQQQLTTNSSAASSNTIASTNSPVVLDRINICINNHYSDTGVVPNALTAGTPAVIMPEETPPLPSPIIPPIQHSGAIDPALLMDSLASTSEVSSNICTTTPVPPVISEPDSTTTSNTPPTTPENINALPSVSSVSLIQSPSTSSTASELECSLNKQSPADGSSITKNTANEKVQNSSMSTVSCTSGTIAIVSEETDASFTPVLPCTSELAIPTTPEILFAIGEDVFVRKEDNRLYLGTVIDSRYQKYRVRFDDKSEVWCSSKEMRKFGNFGESSASPGENSQDDSDLGTLCVACKVRDQAGVEICERCGRGYHHKCTTETASGSNDWLCKRCDKSMKLDFTEKSEDQKAASGLNQLPYDPNLLNWDSKHRVNEEQIYCYCGKSGQFDHNMLQCCKCLNWFHTTCVDGFKGTMLRGDANFIFSCSTCSTDGKEFLRRLQVNAVDFIHLVLYNLSAQRKHQQHKYHHMTKDIWPFVLAQCHTTALPEEWHDLSEDALKECIATTLKANPERFVCGREVKRDCFYYGLRNNGPPKPPKIDVQKDDVLSDVFIMKRLRLQLSQRKLEDMKQDEQTDYHDDQKTTAPNHKDVYEFHSEKEDIDDDDEKFTSDDEIPIKHILEKEKRNKKLEAKAEELTAPVEEDCQASHAEDLQKPKDKSIKENEKRSHKRKAFTLSKPYKETAAAAASKRYHSVRNCDSSSDENSSSSRGTSLDLIIPPPKDFLGLNNPFRNVTPKKNADKKAIPFARSNSGGPGIKNSIVNTSTLDFSSKLAALKSAGIFSNLNATSLAKAAGQPRMVRTIKRRLSAKDIMIGPNQEVRRRRTRRLSANVEVISTTTINPLPSNIFPLNAKDLFSSGGAVNASTRKQNIQNPFNNPASLSPPQSSSNSSTSSLIFREQFPAATKTDEQPTTSSAKPPTHGRRLRARVQKPVINSSRRSSLSGASTSSTSSSCAATPAAVPYPEPPTFNDLQQSVNRYFGGGNRITEGEKFSVYAKRHLPNGQIQYLVEWGNENDGADNADSTTNVDTECVEEALVENPVVEEV